jgi:hypothetical protein
MKLFVNGCSFSHGHTDFEDVTTPLSWVWPSLISDNFESTHNLAWMGGSNARILRTTLEFFDKIKDGSDWVAIIQWSSITRDELHDEETDTYFGALLDSPQPVLAGEDRFKFVHIPDSLVKAVNVYQRTAHLRSTKHMLEKLIYQQFIISNFFKRKNIKFLFTGMNQRSTIPNDFNHPLKQFLSPENNLLPISNFVNPGTPKLIESETDLHPNKEGHRVIAQYITNELKVRNYL